KIRALAASLMACTRWLRRIDSATTTKKMPAPTKKIMYAPISHAVEHFILLSIRAGVARVVPYEPRPGDLPEALKVVGIPLGVAARIAEKNLKRPRGGWPTEE